MSNKKIKIVVISPCRDEEQFLPDLINCMENQTLKPVEWIIVDDGSTDKTAEIVRKANKRNSWIFLEQKKDRGVRSVGPGVVEAFYYGYQRIKTDDWDYICKLDGDLKLPPEYFERLIGYFDRDEYLGAASGKLFLEVNNDKFVQERNSDESVWGCANFYRRKCFESIGGFVRQVMWDGIAFHRARMEGWRTLSIRDSKLSIIERRIMGSSQKNILVGRLRWGEGQYFMGTHPLYIFAIGVYRLFERPFIIGGICIFSGFFLSYIKKKEQYHFNGFKKSLHAWQLERLRFSKRIEDIPAPPTGLYPKKHHKTNPA